MYREEEGYVPYKSSIGLKIFLTTKNIHSHYLMLDEVNPFKLPVRLTTRLGFFSTVSQNYCGKGAKSSCNEENAILAANQQNLSGTEREKFLQTYYKNRFISVFGDIFSRWLLYKDRAKLELMLNYRGRYYNAGDFKNKGPFAGSLFAKDFANSKNDGYLSTLETGLMLDKRDHEMAPTKGYWLESSVRGASFLTASSWDYFGFNAAARLYFSLDDAHRLVFASQTIADLMVGDVPFDAISRIGGSQSIMDYNAIGGSYLGRGISEQRFVGKIKAINQLELRYTFLSFDIWKQKFDLTLAGLGDFAATACDFSSIVDMKNIFLGFGSGLRIAWNKTFIIRADLAFSPHEDYSPKFYLVVGNVF
jgi:outer membrane protein assembly factor BamA